MCIPFLSRPPQSAFLVVGSPWSVLATAATGDPHTAGPEFREVQLCQLGFMALTVRHICRVDREISCDVRATPGAQHYGNQSNYRRLWLDNAEMWRSHGSPQVPTHRGQALHVLHQPLLLCDGDVTSEEHQGG